MTLRGSPRDILEKLQRKTGWQKSEDEIYRLLLSKRSDGEHLPDVARLAWITTLSTKAVIIASPTSVLVRGVRRGTCREEYWKV